MTTVCTTYLKSPDASPTPLVRSCERWEIDLKEFGTENEFETFYRTKLLPLREFLDTVKTEHVMFLDGADTFVISPLEEIKATYHKLADGKVLIGSELNVWPYPDKEKELNKRAREAGSESPYRYVDTGLIMGPTDLVAETIDRLKAYIPTDVGRSLAEDDVGLFVLAMLDGAIDSVIDYGCEMICAVMGLESKDWDMRPGYFHCHLTKSFPHIIHANGHRWIDRAKFRIIHKVITGEEMDIVKSTKKGYRL